MAVLYIFVMIISHCEIYIYLEIPLFHVMNACVTFGNIFGLDEAVHGISAIQEEDRLSCAIDDSCFQVPNDYSAYGIHKFNIIQYNCI